MRLFTLLLLVLLALPVQADEGSYSALQGKHLLRWHDKSTITVFIENENDFLQWVPSIKDAFSQWESVLEKRVHVAYTADRKKYDVRIVITPDTKEQTQTMLGTWGEHLAYAEIRLNPKDPAGIPGAILHQTGHVLGIQVHSDSVIDVMQHPRTGNSHPAQLSPRDIATVRWVYRQKPRATNPKGYYLSEFSRFKQRYMTQNDCEGSPLVILNYDLPGSSKVYQPANACTKGNPGEDRFPIYVPSQTPLF